MQFIHLHNHSHYSLLDGLPKVPELVAEAKKQGMSAVALTDHGVMYGAIEFYQECLKNNIKPIIGVEFYLARRGLKDKKPNIDAKPYHLILLAKNNTGYNNLLKLTSIAHLEGFYYKPRIDWETLEKYHDGLIAMSACLNGQIPKAIMAGDLEEANNLVVKYRDLFGVDSFYLELQSHPGIEDQENVNKELINLSKVHGVGLVATNDVHYLHPEDAEAQDLLMCLQMKKKISDKDRMNLMDFDCSFRPPEKMIEDFASVPEAIKNTEKIARMCNVEIELGKISLPHFELPNNENPDSYLKKICQEGLKERYPDCFVAQTCTQEEVDEINQRLEYELGIIEKTGYASYFLIVQDFVNWAKENNIVVGPGRGSAAGSIVSYLINVTDVDPMKYGLIFERFLNPERISMPDIDIDFADTGRGKIIKYVEDKYGHDHVAQIITFGTMAAKAAIRDVGRALGLGYSYCDRIAKMIPMFFNLEDAINASPELKDAYEHDAEAKQLIDFAKKLEGVARHHSTHACGVLISKDQLVKIVPLQYASSSDQTIISQYSLHPIEDLGLLKMDFLGLKNLTILENVIKIIEKIHEREISLNIVDLEDKKTFKLLQKGQTTGVFQLESSGMKKWLTKLRPNRFEDIIAMVALYRPGPMEFIPDFIKGKQKKKDIVYDDPRLKPILEGTYGIAVYQEQIMEIARQLAGFSYAEADILRKAVGKKIKALLDEQKDKLIDGMIDNGLSNESARKIWQTIEPFASYGFNKAHATCYALIAFQTAYFKANYPTEFMAALLTADQDDIDKIAIRIREASQMGIEVLPPHINKSFSTFTVLAEELKQGYKKIRFGLNAIKNVGNNIVEAIIIERKENGDFKDMEDFLMRVQDKDLNKKSLESLIKSGTMNGFGDINVLLKNTDKLLEFNRYQKKEKINGQSSIFSKMTSGRKFSIKLEDCPDIDPQEKLSWEKEMLGLYISDHPFKDLQKKLSKKIQPIEEVRMAKSAKDISIGGIIDTIQKIVTKKGENMMFARLEDSTGSIEIVVFPKIFREFEHMLQKESMIIVNGRLNHKDGQPKLLVENIEALDAFIKNSEKKDSPLIIKLENKPSIDQMDRLKDLLKQNPGISAVYFYIKKGKQFNKIKISARVDNSEELQKNITRILDSK
jgi:DNA polymerase III subunit alpha